MTQFDTSEKDVLLATAIAAGTSGSEAARQLGISLSTVQRRKADRAFRQLVADLRGEMVATALGRMADKLTHAADAVGELIDAPEAHIRLRAARLLFGNTLRFRDAVDVDERVRDLEEQVASKQGETP